MIIVTKWLHAYWLVVLVSVVLAVLINQIVYYVISRRRSSDERRSRDKVLRSLLGDLRTHCESLQPALLNPSVDAARWKAANDAFQARAREPSVATALGVHYDPFLFALATEARAIVAQERNSDPRSTIGNVADTLIAYAPFIKAFGDAAAARHFESVARRSYDYAKTLH